MSLPVIAITNASTSLSDAQVEAVIPALQKQASTDFNAYWQEDCTLTFLTRDQPLTTGWWQIVVVDTPDQAGALGYHELSIAGTPLGKVFARFDIRNGFSWTVTLSHELLEILADPWINWCAISSDSRVYALEVCDPVESEEMAYEIDGVLVSNFVTPAWFEPIGCDRKDFRKHLTRELEVHPGGYASVFDARYGWKQITARGEGGPAIVPGGRRQRRRMWRKLWRNSER